MPDPPAVVVSEDVPDVETVVVPPPEPEPALAVVEEDQILILEPIRFEVGTANILPQSLPVLSAVATLLHHDATLLHVVIEGHASEEGTFAYNYDLSTQRARAVWEQLVSDGVHPDRVSWRGLGEVVPTQGGTSEEELRVNRRVEFHIVARLAPGESAPEYADSVELPWDGSESAVRQPPPPPEPEPEPPSDEELFEQLFEGPVDDEIDTFDEDEP